MKFNWGTGIALTLGVFILAMGYTMYLVIQQDYDLVTEDYYGEELVYQEKIDQKNAAGALSGSMNLIWSEKGLVMEFPDELQGRPGSVAVQMYSVTEADDDFSFSKGNWEVTDLAIPAEKFKSGKWIAKITLKEDGKAYYFDPEILIP